MIGVDLRSRTLFVDTSSSSLVTGKKTVEEAPLPERAKQNVADGHLLRILVDNSIVEAFACGTQAMRRIYPSRTDSVYFSYWAERGNCELDVALTEVNAPILLRKQALPLANRKGMPRHKLIFFGGRKLTGPGLD